MHRWLRKNVAWLAACVLAPAAVALPVQRAPAAPASSAHALPAPAARPRLCFDQVYFFAFPGKVDYCLGLRDWNAGHYDDALGLLRLAAGWGNKDAQYTLGLIHYGGHHVPSDPVLGMAWLKLADERHNDARITLAARSAWQWATPAQRRQADELFDEMRGTYGDKVAAARAWRQLQRWQANHGTFVEGCVQLRGAQAFAALQAGMARPTDHGACVPFEKQRVAVRAFAEHYFRGLMGTVSVGPPRSVPSSATSSEH